MLAIPNNLRIDFNIRA